MAEKIVSDQLVEAYRAAADALWGAIPVPTRLALLSGEWGQYADAAVKLEDLLGTRGYQVFIDQKKNEENPGMTDLISDQMTREHLYWSLNSFPPVESEQVIIDGVSHGIDELTASDRERLAALFPEGPQRIS